MNPRALIRKVCSEDNIDIVSKTLEEIITKDPGIENDIVTCGLRSAVFHGRPEIVRYLLDTRGASVDTISPFYASNNPSIELFQVLLDHGWDINKKQQTGYGMKIGQRLISINCDNEEIVRWCLDHGSLVENGPYDPVECPSILEEVAAYGTVDTFKLLQARGAQVGKRTLHRAVESAAAAAGETSSEHGSVRMGMVEFLVDEEKLDVNALDTEAQMPKSFGTPLAYAAKLRGGGDVVVKFLLERGADPRVRDCWGRNVLETAEAYQNERVAEILREWVKQHDSP